MPPTSASPVGYCKHNNRQTFSLLESRLQQILQHDRGQLFCPFHAPLKFSKLICLLFPLTLSAHIPLYWLCKIFFLFKTTGCKVADGRYNDIAKCKVNQPCLLGHSWVPITHWGEHQTAQSPHKMIKSGEDRGTRHSFSFPGKASPEPPLRYPCNLT